MKIKILCLLFFTSLISCQTNKTESEQEIFPFEQDAKFGFFNSKGEIVIKPQFELASVFNEGIAVVITSEKGEYRYINEEGKFIFDAKYSMATMFNEGKAIVTVKSDDPPTVIDKDGKTLFTLKGAADLRNFNNDLAAFEMVQDSISSWGFVNVKGEKVIKAQYSEVKDFYEGKSAVKNKEEKCGYIDKTGKLIIDFQFDDALDFEKGKAVVYIEDKAGVINSEGKFIIKPQYQSIVIDGDNFLVQQNDKYGWCDKTGKFFVKPQYEWASGFFNSDLALVKNENENGYGYINKKGEIVIKPQFFHGTSFYGDFAIVKSGEKYGLIDKTGKFTVKPKFETVYFDLFLQINTNSKYKTKSFNRISIF
jgi:hypothetical protein